MKSYELMLIFKPDYPVEDKEKLDALLSKLVKGATIGEVTVLGKKHLEYPIEKQTEGMYVLVHLQADTLKVSDIEREMRLGTDIIRYLLTAQKKK